MVDGIDWGGSSARNPTPAESAFVNALEALVPGLDYWLHEDRDGTPWLLVSEDLTIGMHIFDTLRIDFDQAGFRGGWSPACLNWDDGVRAQDANIDIGHPDGISEAASGRSPNELARVAADWFITHQQRWPTSNRVPAKYRRME